MTTGDCQDGGASRLSVSCLVNHHNYAEFLGDALQSVADQTGRVDEVIVVDDGSAPEQLERVREICGQHSGFLLIEKENGGQISAVARGIEESTGEIVFFLDADDFWDPGYVKAVLDVFGRRPDIDLVATNHAVIENGVRRPAARRPSRDLGYSVVRSSYRPVWLGATTSCLAIRRRMLELLFPVDPICDWGNHADEPIVFGSSMACGRKYFLGDPLVSYRVHGSNSFAGSQLSNDSRFRRRLEQERLCERLRTRLHVPRRLEHLAHYEFRTIESPTRHEYRQYWKLVSRAPIHWRTRLRILSALFTHYHFGKVLPRRRIETVGERS